jgi:hypothetical protein
MVLKISIISMYPRIHPRKSSNKGAMRYILVVLIAFLLLQLPLKAQHSQNVMCYGCSQEIAGVRVLSHGFRRMFFLNYCCLPTFRAAAQLGISGQPTIPIVGKGSYFEINGKYFRVSKVYLHNRRTGEGGHLSYYELPQRPRGVHIVNSSRSGK